MKSRRKKTKKNPLSEQDKRDNRELASQRAINENVIGMLKRFKIIADRYRNRRKRFSLRFNLIAGIYKSRDHSLSFERGLIKKCSAWQNLNREKKI